MKKKVFYDTEFIEDGKTIDLISIGMVKESGEKFYKISNEFNVKKAWDNEWVRENVLRKVFGELANRSTDFTLSNAEHVVKVFGTPRITIKNLLIEFIGDEKIELMAWYADYDHVVLCQLFGAMIDLPQNFPMYTTDLKQICDREGFGHQWVSDNVPKNSNAHNALDDSMWNRDLWQAMSGTASKENLD